MVPMHPNDTGDASGKRFQPVCWMTPTTREPSPSARTRLRPGGWMDTGGSPPRQKKLDLLSKATADTRLAAIQLISAVVPVLGGSQHDKGLQWWSEHDYAAHQAIVDTRHKWFWATVATCSPHAIQFQSTPCCLELGCVLMRKMALSGCGTYNMSLYMHQTIDCRLLPAWYGINTRTSAPTQPLLPP